MSLKSKAIKGFSWTAVEGFFSQGFMFVVGILLARILTPEEFGIIGIITAIVTILNSIIEGGFTSALIRKIDSDNNDYNTVFYTNLITSIIIYLVLFTFSEKISNYFDVQILNKILKISGTIIIINAVTIIQRTLLTKLLDFKKIAIISIISSIISGSISIILAYLDYGIWSLVFLAVSRPLINGILLWTTTKWSPSMIFSKSSFKELFNYGYKLLISNLINTAYKNIYYFIIGKYFSPVSLGYYTRADQFQAPFSNNITLAIRRISFPILSEYQDDKHTLKLKFVKFLKFSIFLNFTVMICLITIAKPLVIVLIGEKWIQSIYYLQMLCIPGILYPLQVLHLNLLLIKGYSNLNLKLEIIKKIILLPLILITATYSIEIMLYGLIFFSIIEFFINSSYTKSILNYTIKEQFIDLYKYSRVPLIMGIVMFLITNLKINNYYMIIIQITAGFIVFVISHEYLNTVEYLDIKYRILNKKKNVK
ncbi:MULTISPECIES: lipopolysaccharide biosynthesis protein [Cellulophaga]|uniref:lipopolysaccharide biosynthesis protein n=1 Tax=Cellulophaga TaxID=104264 RepID=UPI0004039D15|nr:MULTISPECIES: lipopolysaccharide biosynthesis protein [Cellulophaga]AIY13938.1 hypothetical protein M667_12370 [Cellulophaga baltica NN016038]KGK29136.1 hypothetical protein EL45_17965 [Cellulophaga sp. E6(2014)]